MRAHQPQHLLIARCQALEPVPDRHPGQPRSDKGAANGRSALAMRAGRAQWPAKRRPCQWADHDVTASTGKADRYVRMTRTSPTFTDSDRKITRYSVCAGEHI